MTIFRNLHSKIRKSVNLYRFSGGKWKLSRHIRPPYFIRIKEKRFPISAPNTKGTRSVFNEILGRDTYSLKCWIKTLPKNATVVDIGANFGLFSSLIKAFLPKASVTAVEPNPDILDYLRENASKHEFDVTCAAISEFEGTVSLNTSCDSTIASVSNLKSEIGEITVPSISPKNVIELANPRIDLLKVDCEGGERWLLNDDTLLSITDIIVMEYHLEVVRKSWVMERIESAGLKVLKNESGTVSGHLYAKRVSSK